MDVIGVAVVDPDPDVCSGIARRLTGRGPVATYAGVPALVERLLPGRPALVILGPGLADGTGMAAIKHLTRVRPEVGVVVLAPELSTAVLQEAFRSGARDVLPASADSDALNESLDRVAESFAAPPPVPASTAAPPGRGQIVAVFSMKGGSGKTVVATNLAVVLARQSRGPVALVDADLQFGDVTIALRLQPPHTIVDAIPAGEGLDADLLRSLLVVHGESGLLVLAAPLEPALADGVAPADMLRILELLRSFCSHVVIDTPAHFNDVMLAAVEASDEILVVAGMEIPNIKNAKLGLETLRRLGIPETKLRLLVNRSNTKVNLALGEVEQTLGLSAEALIPSDIAVPQSVNRGAPVVLDARRAEVTRAFERLAELFLMTSAEPAKKTRSRFGR